MGLGARNLYASQEENVFRAIVRAEMFSKSHGDRDSASGMSVLVEIPEGTDARDKMRQTLFGNEEPEDYMTDAQVFDLMESGWYFGTIRTGENIFFHECEPEAVALAVFNEAVENYEPFERVGW